MSYWTTIRGRLDIPQFDLYDASDLRKIFEKIFRKNNMLDESAIIDPMTVNNVQANNYISVLLGYQEDDAESKFVASHFDLYFLYSHANKFHFALPFLPLLPTGAEGPMSIEIFYSNKNKTHTAVIDGSLRSFYSEQLPYIDWWFETACAMLHTTALYSYNSYDTGEDITKNVFIESSEKTRSDIIEKYINIVSEWHKIVEEYRKNAEPFKELPSWQDHVLNYLKRDKQN